ncbi:MAG TPA: UDP-glucose 4-epimerase GalE [Dongiaceae bacterium]|nr:UDP-glucose 4-epimerase GalE [Dongiaceae bacterium]
MKTKVLVTGGAGYIGSHVCKALHQAGIIPVTFDNLSTGYDWAVQWGPLEVGDIRDTSRVAAVMKDHAVTAVLHFAAKSLVAESVADPLLYHANNVGGTMSLVEAMLSAGVSKIVFSSTCAVYGIPAQTPIDEDAARNPINPYGQSKLGAENVLMDVARTGKLQVALLRYFNAAGADAALDIGEAHVPESHLIPLAIRAARGGGEALRLFGTDYPTPDGTCLRDYIHVTDLAAAHIAALDYLMTGVELCRFNLGTGQPVSVREVLDAVSDAVGKPVPVIESPRRAGDPPALYAANDAARSQLNWQPQHSDIVTIVRSAVAWEAAYQDRQDRLSKA